jgi:uncharacterized alpha-E superfamily protein
MRRRAPRRPARPARTEILPRSAAYRIFWLGRYLERAEGNARLLDSVHLALLDTPAPPEAVRAEWEAMLKALGLHDEYVQRHGEIDPRKIADFILLDEANLNSVLRCLRMAREDGNGTLPDEIYVALNRLYLRVQGATIERVWAGGLHEFLRDVVEGIQTVGGMIDREWA